MKKITWGLIVALFMMGPIAMAGGFGAVEVSGFNDGRGTYGGKAMVDVMELLHPTTKAADDMKMDIITGGKAPSDGKFMGLGKTGWIVSGVVVVIAAVALTKGSNGSGNENGSGNRGAYAKDGSTTTSLPFNLKDIKTGGGDFNFNVTQSLGNNFAPPEE